MSDFLQQLMSRNNPALNPRLRSAVVGIAGCGGLGSNIAVALTRAGIGKLVLADFDTVETSNLNRQHYFVEDIGRPKVDALEAILRRINPDVRIETHHLLLDAGNLLEVFAECLVVAEAFHSAAEKSMIVNAFAAEAFRAKFLVCASGLAGIHSSNLIQTQKLARNVFACGDFLNAPDRDQGLMAPRVMIAAGHQANMILRLLAGESTP